MEDENILAPKKKRWIMLATCTRVVVAYTEACVAGSVVVVVVVSAA
jgi:hypothetical protein